MICEAEVAFGSVTTLVGQRHVFVGNVLGININNERRCRVES